MSDILDPDATQELTIVDAPPVVVGPAPFEYDVPLDAPAEPLVEPVVELAAEPVVDLTAGSAPGADAATEPGAEAAGSVDPRFEQRRADVESDARADRRRRRRRTLSWIAGLLLLAVVGAGAVYSPLLDVDRIDIIGTKQLGLAELAEKTGLRIGDPITLLDVGAVESTLRRDPRFVRVVVERQFPSRVSIRVTDRRAIARVAGPHRGVIVGEGGVIIAVARGDEFLRTIEVSTDPPTRPGRRLSAPLAAAVDVMGAMSYEIAVQIEKMSITPEGELVFDLGDHRTVLFGSVADADKKLLTVKTMLGPQVDTSGLCQLDVRVPSAPTIRRKPDCDPPPPPAPTVADPAAAAAAAAAGPAATPTTPTTAVPTTLAPDPMAPDTIPPVTVPVTSGRDQAQGQD
ncbi:MAG: FtsQ-type POTRA domain-containing protein [Acidimicrobiales bacterium]